MPPRIESKDDLVSYKSPDPADSPVIEKIRKLKERYPDGEKAVVLVGESGWAPAVFLRAGMENLLLDYLLNPGLARDLARMATDYCLEAVENSKKRGR